MPNNHRPPTATRVAAGTLRLNLPFRRSDALQAGLTDDDLISTRFRRLLHGIYISADVPVTPAITVLAAMRTVTGTSFATHHTAATLLGAAVPLTAWTHLGTVAGAMTVRRQIRLRRYAALPPLVVGSAVPCTDPAQTFLDLAAHLELVDLVVLGDSLVARGLITVPGLVKAAARYQGPAARLARLAAGYVRARVESPMETRVRMLFVLAGFPEPSVNVEVLDQAGHVRYRIDLAWPDVRVAVEYDGRHHITREPQWTADLRRREELEADGWRFLVLTATDIYREPEATLDRAARVLAERGIRVGRRRTDWAAHFPSRRDATA